ncbi:hypothetical protein Tdes44962_MAKER09037 [Teratosphaeria destructans]|uniref:Uncharacterized protein n=1 Tax=Teratosphaeria destructans TaxID=418781 RepID=A0A9W7SU73_9PEZI|nr:hypothetical protein Tdes44962_MAKER09037 [Teratosphaeria destructans]
MPNGQTYYYVRWEDESCDWIPVVDMPSGPLLDRFLSDPTKWAVDEEEADETAEALEELDRQNGNPYREALRLGYSAVVKQLWKEIKTHSVCRDMPPEYFPQYALEILAAVPYRLLEVIYGLIDGAWKYLEVDAKSDSEGVYKWAVSVDLIAGNLDSDEKRAIRDAKRRYLPSDSVVDNLKDLLRRLEDEVNELPHGDDRPPFLLRDVGYTDNAERRIEDQHLKHRSTNQLMCLFEALAIADDDLEEGDYRLRPQIVFLSFKDDHARYAEPIFSILARSYTTTSRGFNAVEGGLATTSSERWETRLWRQWQKEVVDEGLFKSNCLEEISRLERRSLNCSSLSSTLGPRRFVLSSLRPRA